MGGYFLGPVIHAKYGGFLALTCLGVCTIQPICNSLLASRRVAVAWLWRMLSAPALVGACSLTCFPARNSLARFGPWWFTASARFAALVLWWSLNYRPGPWPMLPSLGSHHTTNLRASLLEVAPAFGVHLRDERDTVACISSVTALAADMSRRSEWETLAARRARGCHPSTSAAAAVAPHPSLSLAHICSPQGDMDFLRALPAARVARVAARPVGHFKAAKRGGCVQFRSRFPRRGRNGGGHRGRIAAFTDAARLRMLKLVNSFDSEIVSTHTAFFVTLTYGRVFPRRHVRWKQQLRALRWRLERAFGPMCIVWKLEPQGRGAPHFHLLGFAAKGLDLARLSLVVRDAWSEIVDRNGRSRRLSGVSYLRTSVEAVRTFGGVIAYASKPLDAAVYASKGSGVFVDRKGQPLAPGRFWGVWRKELAVSHDVGEVTDEAAQVCIRRAVRKCVQRRLRGRFSVRRRKNGRRVKVYARADARGWTAASAPSFTAFIAEADLTRLTRLYCPWVRAGLSYDTWRSLELEVRRRVYLAAIIADWEFPLDPFAHEASSGLEFSHD